MNFNESITSKAKNIDCIIEKFLPEEKGLHQRMDQRGHFHGRSLPAQLRRCDRNQQGRFDDAGLCSGLYCTDHVGR